MKPRQPYRSPFWRPDPAGESGVPFGGDAKPVPAAAPERPARATPQPPQPRIERATPDHANTYAPSDLALFGRLMDFGKRTQGAARPAEEPASPRPQRREDQTRRHEVAPRAEAAGAYTSRDLTLFQNLQPPVSGVRRASADASHQPISPSSPAATRSYSQADLDAFDKLTRFGRSS